MPLAFDKTAGNLVSERLHDAGINVITEDTAERVVTDNGKIKEIILKSGKSIEADALIFAIGVRPDVELAKSAGVEVGRGILVDDKLMTNLDNIYAVGDVSETYDITHKERRVTPILPNAYNQGKQGGRNIASASSWVLQTPQIRSWKNSITISRISLTILTSTTKRSWQNPLKNTIPNL